MKSKVSKIVKDVSLTSEQKMNTSAFKGVTKNTE